MLGPRSSAQRGPSLTSEVRSYFELDGEAEETERRKKLKTCCWHFWLIHLFRIGRVLAQKNTSMVRGSDLYGVVLSTLPRVSFPRWQLE